jgi:hypothetical protein
VLNGGPCNTLDCDEKKALEVCRLGSDRRLERERVEVNLVAQLQHMLARSGRLRIESLRRLSMLAAWVLRVQFLEERIVQFLEKCRVPSTSSERLLKHG